MAIWMVQPQSDQEWRQARALIEQYAASLDLDLSFQNLPHELEHLASEYSPPTGAFLLAGNESTYLGCVGLREFAAGVGEIKRLYALPAARGQHIGRRLAEAIVEIARQRGYARLLLDTLPSMTQAQSLYASLGFKPTAAYRFNPVPGTVYLELTLWSIRHTIMGVETANPTTRALTVQLLEWILLRPRTYAETLEAWRTSCPRLSIWEDACIDGLIEIAPGGRIVAVSAKGELLLKSAHAQVLPR